MANNRLYIYDPETNRAVGIAKHFCAGWYVPVNLSENDNLAKSLDAFFEELDSNKGWGDMNGTKLKLLTEGQLPEAVEIIRHQD